MVFCLVSSMVSRLTRNDFVIPIASAVIGMLGLNVVSVV